MEISVKKLKELLLGPGHVAEEAFEAAYKRSVREGRGISGILLEEGLIKDEELGQVVAEFFGFPFVNLRHERISDAVLELIPEKMAAAKGAIVFYEDKDGIRIGMRDPGDLETRHAIEQKTGKKARAFFVTRRDFEAALSRYLVNFSEQIALLLKKRGRGGIDPNKLNMDLVDLVMRYGFFSKASDIHLEPYENEVVVRFRIDGVLHDMLKLPRNLYDPIVSRIKILSKMRTDEHMAAQDGKFSFKTKSENVDVRVSIVPVTEGENVVMRLLSSRARDIDLESLGFNPGDLGKVGRALKNPHGMVLVTGPTGSGKTTTIYEMLKILNKKEVHIATIEDPVEYDIEGISQIQVNPKTNLTFASGLRAIVRQDPDIIMVGEIRDRETADIAVNSAMTGHLVLSTLHANDASTTLPRLLDMGIEPFLAASTVRVVIAQRLIRKICEKCRASYELSDSEIAIVTGHAEIRDHLGVKDRAQASKLRLYRGEGCKSCARTGFSGRIGIFEVMELKEALGELVMARAGNDRIMKRAKADGMTTMLYDGLRKVMSGVTTLEEVLRVTEIR